MSAPRVGQVTARRLPITGQRFERVMHDAALIITTLLLALCVWVLASTPDLSTGCTSFDAQMLTDSEVRGLQHAGWFASATDGQERIYSPACEWAK